MMAWSVAIDQAERMAERLGLCDDEGDLPGNAVLAAIVPDELWRQVSLQMREGTISPQDYLEMMELEIRRFETQSHSRRVRSVLKSLSERQSAGASVSDSMAGPTP